MDLLYSSADVSNKYAYQLNQYLSTLQFIIFMYVRES